MPRKGQTRVEIYPPDDLAEQAEDLAQEYDMSVSGIWQFAMRQCIQRDLIQQEQANAE